jgi:hypothetical protein
MLFWRNMDITWTDRVRNGEVLHTDKKERHILYTIKGRKANWFDHILRRKCLLKHFIEGKMETSIEVTERQKNINSYWMALRKGENTGNRKH